MDGSANSGNALEYGVYIAPKLGASLTGLHIIDVFLIQGPMMTDVTATVGMPPYEGFLEAVKRPSKEKGRRHRCVFQKRCRAAGVACRAKTNIGKISDTIIEEAENADLILMAKNAFHLKEGGLIGSVAEVVIRQPAFWCGILS